VLSLRSTKMSKSSYFFSFMRISCSTNKHLWGGMHLRFLGSARYNLVHLSSPKIASGCTPCNVGIEMISKHVRQSV